MKLLPKLLILLLLIAYCSSLIAPAAQAYTAPLPSFGPNATPPPPQPGEGTLGGFQKSLALPGYNKESFDFQSLNGVMASMTSLLVGCVVDENRDGKVDYDACPKIIQTGALPTMGTAIAGIISNPPASGVGYLADVGQRLNLVKPAYAQAGFGFGAIEPFVIAWRAVRNFTYLLFVIAGIGMGIAIMFRTRISPQAVITVQSSLPRITVGLIFITFSYAIVGLLIDLIYVIFGLLVFGLATFGLPIDPNREFDSYRNAGFANVVGFIFQRGLSGGKDVIGGIDILPFLPDAINEFVKGILGLLSLFIPVLRAPTLLLLLPLLAAVIFFLFRVLFALARAYILLLFHLIFAPILILWGSMGIAGGGIWTTWLRGTIANILVFPFVGIVIFLTEVLLNATPSNIWGPPYIGSTEALVDGMIALGAVLLLPTIPDIINQLLGARPIALQLPEVGQRVQQAIQAALTRRVPTPT